MLRLNVKLSQVLLLRLRATFHTLPLLFCERKFYARTLFKITRQWKSTLIYRDRDRENWCEKSARATDPSLTSRKPYLAWHVLATPLLSDESLVLAKKSPVGPSGTGD